MRKIDSTDIAFINDTFPAYTKSEVCTKLGISGREYETVLRGLGLPDANHRNVTCPKLDWPSIWYAYTRVGTVAETAKATGYAIEAVRYAVDSMLNMPTTRRAAYWNRWAHKNGREEYAWEEANGII